jgi:Sulfotransferase family
MMAAAASSSTQPVLFPDFFIVGVARSGTTLVRAIVTGHPCLTVPAETGFLPILFRITPLWWRRGRLRREMFTRLVFANGRLRRAGIQPRQLMDRLTRFPPRSPAEAVSRIYELFGGEEPSARVGDKTPGYEQHVGLLAEHFPAARFIHVVRHPLDVVASLIRQPWGPNDPLAAGMLWLRGVRACAEAASFHVDTMLVVRLEDLIDEPAGTVEKIASYLGVAEHPDMLRFTHRAQAISEQNVHPSGHAGLARPLATTRHWRDDLSESDAAHTWSLVGSTAERFGYSGPSDVPAKVSERDAALRLARFRVARSWRRGRTLLQLTRP